MKYAIFGPIWAQKWGFGPKFGVGQMMVDIRYVTNVSKYRQNPLSPSIDDLTALNHRYLLKYAIFGPIWAQNGDLGPYLGLDE